MQPLQICIGPIIRIGRESWCLPYAGFFKHPLENEDKCSTCVQDYFYRSTEQLC